MKTKFGLISGLLVATACINYFLTFQPESFSDEIALLLSITVIGLAYYFLYNTVLQPLQALKAKARQIIASTPATESYYEQNDEIATAVYALSQLSESIQNATDFIKKIESGHLDTVYTGINADVEIDKNGLAGALLSMRKQMKQLAAEEEERKWITEGLAKFGDILRANSSEVNSLSYHVVTNLVQYLKANQGGLFLVNEEEECLELRACYAYDRKKYIQKKITLGQGLVGQAYLEKDYIHLTQVPENYVSITSGLGNANPSSILIVPLQVNGLVLGIVELASFSGFKKYQIEFLQKVGENIASTISAAKINERTKQLLDESQQQAEQMKAQEEEMRQNLEELMATQESQQRLQHELKNNEIQLTQKLSELQQAKEVLENKENELKLTIEKNLKRSNQFKQKMEELDIQLEAKDSQINVLKEEKNQLQAKLATYESN